MNIPIPEYCTLDKAAQLIGCEVFDLVHFGEIGAIKLCVLLNKEVEVSLSVLPSEEQHVSYKDGGEWVGGFYSKFVTKEDPELSSEKEPGWYDFSAVISGLWEIHKISKYGVVESNIPNSLSNRLISIDSDFAYAMAELVNITINFDINELFVFGNDIKKIIEFREKRIPCRINEFECEFNIAMSEDTIQSQLCDREEKPKTINARAQFIKSLLYTMYDKDVAENPRRFLDNPDSEISRLFFGKGVKAPSGRAVQTWLEMVDIPFKDS
jgi:hypothetical protein